MQKLESMSRASGHTFSNLDHLYLALGWGYGHGACHVLFFFASLLPLTAGDGTFYTGEVAMCSLTHLVAGDCARCWLGCLVHAAVQH